MDITSFIAAHREALLIADYNTYRTQLSRQILATRKRLGGATPRREKFAPKAVTAEDVGSNRGFVDLLLLMSERAWAHAMHIKTSHTEDNSGRGITGPTRNHIISRLTKAAKTASELVDLLYEQDVSKATDQDLLEVRAYKASLMGAEEFEKASGGQRSAGGLQVWQSCLSRYAIARVIYAALFERDKREVYREILANTVDPTIRYAAYQAGLPRTLAIATVAKRYFPNEDAALVKLVEHVDRFALKDKPAAKTEDEKQATPQDVPNSVTWRNRKANIVDASIGQALASVGAAETRLRSYLATNPAASNRDKAAAYDDVLVASQDAADATKRATDELEKEKVDESDPRMQDLRVTSLAVNYDLVSWRVGRNRTLIGDDDGMAFEPQVQRKPKRLRKDGSEYPEKEEGRGRKLARLRERNVLFDATIQSINSIKDLRGAMRDAKFVEELEAKASYFRALKCSNISYSHSLLGSHLNALALLKRAQDLMHEHPLPSSASLSRSDSSSDVAAPPTLDIQTKTFEQLRGHITTLLSRTHARVEMHNLESASAASAAKSASFSAPLVQNLAVYPAPGVQVDLKNLVTYPPKIEPVPVKPLFLDVAWNYIEYPGRKKVAEAPVVNGSLGDQKEPQPERRKGWFGFGR